MKCSLRLNNKLTTLSAQVSSIRVTNIDFSPDTPVSVILTFLKNCRQQYAAEGSAEWLMHPLQAELRKQTPLGHAYFYLEPNLKLNRLFAERGTLSQQIEYLDLMGVTDAIERRPDLRVAVTYHHFCADLFQLGIVNPSLSMGTDDLFLTPIKRIHAVHPLFLNDAEISSGLHISIQKNVSHDQVLYVCSPETLELAVSHCLPNTTLIVDGHWEHGKRATHGVWETADAAEIGRALARLLSTLPGKINAIRLLGCEAGHLPSFESLPTHFKPGALVFKDDCFAHFHEQEMAAFRNRSIYYSENGEFPFADTSLAGQIILQMANPSIKVTATSSRTYPFPPGLKARFNIGSDAEEWTVSQVWSKEIDAATPDWYRKLHCLKSITVIHHASDTENRTTRWPKKCPHPNDHGRVSPGVSFFSTSSAPVAAVPDTTSPDKASNSAFCV